MTQAQQTRDLALREDASSKERAVLDRIDLQRERLYRRRVAQQQAVALQHPGDPDYAMSHGSLVERLFSFGRQHPVVCAAAVGAAVLLGPRKMLRVATMAMPIIMKMRR